MPGTHARLFDHHPPNSSCIAAILAANFARRPKDAFASVAAASLFRRAPFLYYLAIHLARTNTPWSANLLHRLPALTRARSVKLLALCNIHGRFARHAPYDLLRPGSLFPRARTAPEAPILALMRYSTRRLVLVSPPSWRRISTPRPKPSVTTGGRAGFQPAINRRRKAPSSLP